MTPMLIQYREIKDKYPDAILFYRMGDFYEMFFEDALKAAPILEVQLTSRDRSAANPIPMCGVPHHSASVYLQKLIAKGMKVAICEQMEDPATAKGIVRRDVIRVVTPALVGDPDLVALDVRNILVCLHETEEKRFEVGVLDLLGGERRWGVVDSLRALTDLFLELCPKEVLIPKAAAHRRWLKELLRVFPQALVTERDEYFIPPAKAREPVTISALNAYLKETQKLDHLDYLGEPLPLLEPEKMSLDPVTLAALEIVRANNVQGDAYQTTTLAQILDRTETPMGRRTLKEWLVRPLAHAGKIEARLEAVQALLDQPTLANELKQILSQIRDLERLTTKTALGLAMPRDLVTMREILRQVPRLKQLLAGARAEWLKKNGKRMASLAELTTLLGEALDDNPPSTLREGDIFRDSYRPEIASLRSLSRDAKSTIATMETLEKTRTGIGSLKIKYSKVFGYTIEVTKSYLGKVPAEYIRKQTIANGERFITQELKAFEEKIITAEQKLRSLEEALFIELRAKVADNAGRLLANARAIAELDVILSFAQSARLHGYQRPQIDKDGKDWRLEIEEGRHPVVETLLPKGGFVPNSIAFSEEACRTLILTGPNMAGKSTIMRQVALIVLMAHAGSFVPARRAHVPLVDAIFTRIGSSDDLTRGRSTFMVEMTEMTRILERATPRSLILIDEIGRGTSTYDGLSLAWSLLEHIHTQVRAKTLFATHFHEVTELEKSLPGLQNANVLVEKWKSEIVFLHKLGPGICNQSYGIEVAKLAGLPSSVLSRAKEILGHLESQSQRANRARNRALGIHENQMAFFDDLEIPESRTGLEV